MAGKGGMPVRAHADPWEPVDFGAPKVAGAMAKGEACRRPSLARLASNLPSFPSALDWAQRPCFGGMRAR
jgi:hypothetical protein